MHIESLELLKKDLENKRKIKRDLYSFISFIETVYELFLGDMINHCLTNTAVVPDRLAFSKSLWQGYGLAKYEKGKIIFVYPIIDGSEVVRSSYTVDIEDLYKAYLNEDTEYVTKTFYNKYFHEFI